jgi:hypothetical protein
VFAAATRAENIIIERFYINADFGGDICLLTVVRQTVSAFSAQFFLASLAFSDIIP